MLWEIIQQIRPEQSIIIVFIDFVCASDTSTRTSSGTCSKRTTTLKIFRLIAVMNRNNRARVRVGRQLLDKSGIRTAIRQGSVLGSLLFS